MYTVDLFTGMGIALGLLGWWGGTFLMGQVGPVLLSSPLKTDGTFYLLSGMCLLAFLHVLLLLPETKVILIFNIVYWSSSCHKI